jgi:sterol 3beta-glucosyltransferase
VRVSKRIHLFLFPYQIILLIILKNDQGALKMRITILAIGSRGDIQPYMALSKGLSSAGHSVRLATHTAFATLVRSHDIDFFPLDDEPHEFFQTDRGRASLNGNTNAFVYLYRLVRMLDPLIDGYMERCGEACKDADSIIVTYLSFLLGYSLAERLKKPLVATFLQPSLLPTKAFPEPTAFRLPQRPQSFGETLNYQSHLGAGTIFWKLFTPAVNRARKSIYHLPPLPKESLFATLPEHVALILYGYSTQLLSKPDDWGETTHVTGFWMLEHAQVWHPEPDLIDFLQSGPPPVYIGFGSMSSYHPGDTLRIAQETLLHTGQRGIILVEKDYMREQKISEQIYVTNGVPHDWLFPRMSVIIHHGGAGTTAASLLAGKPTIVVSHIVDQQFWGDRIAFLGVGPRPLSRRHLSAGKLEKALHSVIGNEDMKRKAEEVGKRLREENGVEQAVCAINTLVGNVTVAFK